MSITAFSKTVHPVGCEEGTRNKRLLHILQTELYLGEKIIKNYETMRNLPLDFSSRGKYMQTKKVKRGNIMTNTENSWRMGRDKESNRRIEQPIY